ncbi:MAG: hypothetical protein JW889_11370 [Verrucomicrobia bacterium]|nr:hypothetical protein [Verrucomicrobiota bacterium]
MHDEKYTIIPTIDAARVLSRWELALCQHPMLLLIKEDTLCAERDASWGGDFDHHMARLERNLASLDRYPDLCVCFDFAAVELELVAEHRPDLIATMRDMLRVRRITLVNGTWSQPHVQCLGHESVYRQFELGLATIKRLLGAKVRTFASQEPVLTEQMPQLLDALGYETATLTHFAWTLTFRTPHPLLGYRGRLYFYDAEPFTTWRALDGTGIPFYLADVGGPLHGGISDDGVFWEYQKDKLRAPAVRINYPDMIAPDDAWIEAQTRNGRFVLLDDALRDLLKQRPPRSEAAITPSFSTYGEGTGGSRLSILNREAETALRQARAAEVFRAVAGGRRAGSFADELRTLLTCQHHDAYWPGGPELRAKSIARLEALVPKLRERMRAALVPHEAASEVPGRIVVFNSLPRKRRDVARTRIEGERPAPVSVLDEKGRVQPTQVVPTPDGWEVWLTAAFGGLGTRSFRTQPEAREPKAQPVRKAWKFANKHYSAVIQPNLTLTSLRASDARESLAGPERPANEIRGMTGAGEWVSTAELAPKETRLVRGPVADVAWVHFELPQAGLTLMGAFFHDLPWAEFTARFEFSKASYGDYWKDESKLHIRWPLAFDGAVRYEVPFGQVESSAPERPAQVIGWLDISSQQAGVTYLQSGMLKHWVSDGTLCNLLAWGTRTNHWNSRCYGAMEYAKQFDLTLNGAHIYRWAVMPHAGLSSAAGAPDIARRFAEPLTGTITSVGAEAVQHPDILRIAPDNLEPVTIESQAGKLRCLVFERAGRRANPAAFLHGKRTKCRATTLDGVPRKTFAPFQIGWLEIPLPKQKRRSGAVVKRGVPASRVPAGDDTL